MNVIVPKTVNAYQTQYNAAKKAENICKKLMTTAEQDILMKNYDAANMNCDAVCLYVLHKEFGFTAEQLKTYFDKVTATFMTEKDEDLYRASYGVIPQRTALKDELGIDLDAWYEEAELNGNFTNNG